VVGSASTQRKNQPEVGQEGVTQKCDREKKVRSFATLEIDRKKKGGRGKRENKGKGKKEKAEICMGQFSNHYKKARGGYERGTAVLERTKRGREMGYELFRI